MSNSEGWIKIHRKIIDWEHYRDHSTLAVFIDILLNANIKEGNSKGTVVRYGELVTSVGAISERTGCGAATVRRCLKKLEDSGEISSRRNQYGLVIHIRNFWNYQSRRPIQNERTGERTGELSDERTGDTLSKKNKKNKEIYTADALTAPQEERDLSEWA